MMGVMGECIFWICIYEDYKFWHQEILETLTKVIKNHETKSFTEQCTYICNPFHLDLEGIKPQR